MEPGDAEIGSNREARVKGFDSEIDEMTCLISEVSHKLDAAGGFTMALQMVSLGALREQ